MRQLRFLPVFLIVLSAFIHLPTLPAQSGLTYAAIDDAMTFKKKKKKKKKDSDYSLKDHLWYGAGLTLGFSGGNDYSLFGFGISPMVGYKLVGPLSAGPRVSILYTSFKVPGAKAANLFDTELSLFLRCRVYKGFFIQGEVGTIIDKYISDIVPVGPSRYEIKTGTLTRGAQYLGIGYNFSNGEGGAGQEIAILYDFYVGNDINSYEQPWQYRIAFTFGF